MHPNSTVRLWIVVVACFAVGGTCAAQAEPEAAGPVAEPPWYVGAGVGLSSAYELRIQSFLVNLTNLAFFPLFVDVQRTDTVDMGSRVFAGYRFNRVVALELGVEDLGEWSRTGTLQFLPLLPGGPALEAQGTEREKARVAVLTSVLHLKKPRWLFFRVGGFYWDTESVVTFDETDEPDRTRSDSGGNFLFGLGADIRLARRFALRFQADHFLDVGPDDQNRILYSVNGLARF